MTLTSHTASGIAYDRAGPRGGVPVLLLHAGVADRRMWDRLWADLTPDHDVVRLDFRGFGESESRPSGMLAPLADVVETLDSLEVRTAHVVGASFGAGVAVELALTRPSLVTSLVLIGPGGSLLEELTPDLESFVGAERDALAAGDLDAAVEANVVWWVDGPHRGADVVDPAVRDAVRRMQRRAFDLTADWDDLEEEELDPPPFERLAEIEVPTLVLLGALDLDAITNTAHRLAGGITGAELVTWPDTAHLPSMERPDDVHALVRDWLTR